MLKRPQILQNPEAHKAALLRVSSQAEVVTPGETLNISRHDSDNRFYEYAGAANADYIITGNSKQFPKPY